MRRRPRNNVQKLILNKFRKKIPMYTAYNKICEENGDDVINYPDFEFWWFRFANGMFNLNHDRKNDPKARNLTDLPIHIIDNIVKRLEHNEQFRLRKVSRDFRRFIDRSSVHHKKVTLKFKKNQGTLYFADRVTYYNLPMDVFDGIGSTYYNRRVENETYLSLASFDLTSILMMEGLELDLLQINVKMNWIAKEPKDSTALDKVYQAMRYMSTILKKSVRVKKIELRVEKEWHVATILSLLEPGVLEEIKIEYSDRREDWMRIEEETVAEMKLDRIAEMPQWKKAQIVRLKGFRVPVASAKHFYGFNHFETGFTRFKPEQIENLKKNTMSNWGTETVIYYPPEPEDPKITAYNRRQKRVGEPIVIPTTIRHPSTWPSCLQDFDLVETKKITEELPNCLRTLPSTSGFLKPPTSPSSTNNKWLESIIQGQIKRIRDRRPYQWMRQAVFYPLGPQQLKRLEEFPLRLPNAFRYQLLVQYRSAFLAVSCIHSKEHTIQMIEEALGSSGIDTDEIFLSTQNSVMNLKYGEQPKILSEASESTLLVVIDDTPKNKNAKKYYEDRLGFRIVRSRVLSYPEKRLIERKSGDYNLRQHPIRLIEFYSNKDRQKAKDLLKSVDVLFCGAMHRHTDIHESVSLFLAYEMNIKNDIGVAVTIKNEWEKDRITHAFSCHGLKVVYYKNHEEDDDLQYDENIRTFVLHNFPYHYTKTEQRLKLVKEIIEKNCMQIDNVELYEHRVRGALRSFHAARAKDIVKFVEEELIFIASRYNIYDPKGPRDSRDDIPWVISKKSQKNIEHITVYFKEPTSGRAMLEAILEEKKFKTHFLALDHKDHLGPQVTPCMRKSFSISRTIRAAMDTKLHRLDKQIRTTFPTLAANDDPIMEEHESLYYAARLFDEWDMDSDTGIIGVMGWCPRALDHFIRRLRTLLTPLTLEDTPELLSGVGEVYVKSLMEKYEGALVVEIDRFAQCVQLIGDAAEEALEDLRKFKDQKEKLQMFTEIPVGFPHLNPTIRDAIHIRAWEDLRMALGIDHLRFDMRSRVIEFEGNVAAYEKLMEILEQFSAEIFKKETSGREDPTCPTCWTNIDVSSDYFRFHCGHVMCRLCANAKIRTMTSTKLVCEQEGCEKLIAPSEIKNLILGGANRIKDLDTEKLIDLNRIIRDEYMLQNNLGPCSTVDCLGMRSQSEEGDIKKCVDCSAPYCGGCKRNPHPGVSCEEHRNLRQPDVSLQVYIRSVGAKNVKRCPKCDMMVEKISGCNHMECKKCRTHFCWICLHYVDGAGSGPIYGHLLEVHGGAEDMGPINWEQGGNPNLPAAIRRQQAMTDAAIHRAVMEDFVNQGVELLPLRVRAPPRLPTPPPVPQAIQYTVLPPGIRNTIPRHDEDMYLEFINQRTSLEEQNQRIAHLLNHPF
uniref:F-box domain-containing protein n=2 Tax=Caenorhabditis tropicalis TaxID=1561998 RepID=A0A1I7UPB7_9PELO